MTHRGEPPDPDPRRRRIPAGIALFVLGGSLLLGLLLNAPDILATAERQPPGWQRTVGVAVMDPVATISHALLLDRPRMAIDSLLGRGETAVEAEGDPTPAGPSITTTTPPARPATPTSPPAPQRRQVTAGDPLVMYIGGDSLVGQFGPVLDDIAASSGLVESEVAFDFSSGLSRPDFLDWPARLSTVSAELDPDVFLLYFGGNDAQAIYMPDGSWIEFGTPEWESEYRRRVAGVMADLTDAGHWVYWMGLPIVRSETFRPRVELMNEVYESEAARHEQVAFIEAWSVFQGPEGGYSEYLVDESGDLVDMRLDDGVHYTTAGATRLARVAYGVIAEDWGLPTG